MSKLKKLETFINIIEEGIHNEKLSSVDKILTGPIMDEQKNYFEKYVFPVYLKTLRIISHCNNKIQDEKFCKEIDWPADHIDFEWDYHKAERDAKWVNAELKEKEGSGYQEEDWFNGNTWEDDSHIKDLFKRLYSSKEHDFSKNEERIFWAILGDISFKRNLQWGDVQSINDEELWEYDWKSI